MEKLLSINEICERTGTQSYFWAKRVKSGELPHIRLGNRVRVRETDLEAFLKAQENKPAPNSRKVRETKTSKLQ